MTREEIWILMALAAVCLAVHFWRRVKEARVKMLMRESPCLGAIARLNARQDFALFDENYLIEFSCANRFRFERFDFGKAALSASEGCPGFYEELIMSCLANRRKLSEYESAFEGALLLSGNASAAQKLGMSGRSLAEKEARAAQKMRLSAGTDFNVRVRVYFGPKRRKRFKEAVYNCEALSRLFSLRDEMAALDREKRALARFQMDAGKDGPPNPELIN